MQQIYYKALLVFLKSSDRWLQWKKLMITWLCDDKAIVVGKQLMLSTLGFVTWILKQTK